MRLDEFLEQDKYCRENNTPEGLGCDACPAIDRVHCADALRNLCGRLIDSINTPQFNQLSRQLDKEYGITPYHQLVIWEGILEFPE